MRARPSLIAALKRSSRHEDALEFTQLFHSINFAHTLRVSDAVLERYDAKKGLETTHEITKYLCRTDEGGTYLSAGVITAIFDEISTAACILQDRTHRPGVSVALDVEVMANITPGRSLRLKTWADKIGKSLAFLRLDLRDAASDQLVAVGKHCKYLPMAGVPFWDMAFTPLLYPIVRKSLLGLTRRHVATGERVNTHDASSIFDHFPLDNLTLENESDKGDERQRLQATRASLHVKPRHCNGLFKMHGGALAVAAEEIALLDVAARKKESTSQAPRARALSLHYLQANDRVVDLAAWTLQDACEKSGGEEGGDDGLLTQIEVRRGGKLCNSGSIIWQ